MSRSCVVAVVISTFATIVVAVVLQSSSSSYTNIWCVEGVVPWGRDSYNDTTTKKLVGSYGGVAALQRVVPDQDAERWLSEQDPYTLHKPVRRRFKRRCVVVGGPNQQWQADLVNVSRLKKTNDGTSFLLTVIDVFS